MLFIESYDKRSMVNLENVFSIGIVTTQGRAPFAVVAVCTNTGLVEKELPIHAVLFENDSKRVCREYEDWLKTIMRKHGLLLSEQFGPESYKEIDNGTDKLD